MSLRTEPSLSTPEVVDVRPPFSNFDFVEKNFGYSNPLKRILSLVRMADFSTMVVEKIKSVGFSQEDDEDLRRLGVKPIEHNLVRLSFFKTVFASNDVINSQNNEGYLGYAILKNFPTKNGSSKWVIFEAIVKPSRHVNNFYHVGKRYEILCGSKIFTIRGTIYCQQNTYTSACAHVALRTAIATLLNFDDISYKKMNDILVSKNIAHTKESKGLNEIQIRVILDELKIKYSVIGFDTADSLPYQKFIYGSMESGYPVLLGFYGNRTIGHVIPILGHTFNEDTWVPRAETSYFKVGNEIRYVPSEIWVSTYICHDDNFGPHFCVPRQYLSTRDNIIVIAFDPDEAKYDAVSAEVIGGQFLNQIMKNLTEKPDNDWLRRLKDAVLVENGWVVLRPLFISGKQYLSHLKDLRGWENEAIDEGLIENLSKTLKDYYWVIEISLPELFPANKRKLGEIVLNATTAITPQTSSSAYVFARLPGNFIWLDTNGDQKFYLTQLPSNIKTHTSLYGTNLAHNF